MREGKRMKYKLIGKTGIKLSRLGFGCMRFPEMMKDGKSVVNDELTFPLLRRAYELGINYFDTAWGYCNGDSQRAVGAALHDVRDKVYISTKLPMWEAKKASDFDYLLDEALRRLDTDYIDFYHFHSVNITQWQKIKELKLLDKMERAKADGKIRHISFSYHDVPELICELVDTEMFESLLCEYNLIDRVNEKSMHYAVEHGVGVNVMGPVGGGNITMGGDDLLHKFRTRAESAAELAFRFVLGNDDVTTALSGMSTMEMLEENVRYIERLDMLDDEERTALLTQNDAFLKLSKLYCTGCGYCEVCPKGIIPQETLRLYNRHAVWGLDEAVKKAWPEIGREHTHPSECVGCGLCAQKCPQKIEIPKMLKKAVAELDEFVK